MDVNIFGILCTVGILLFFIFSMVVADYFATKPILKEFDITIKDAKEIQKQLEEFRKSFKEQNNV